MFEDFKTLATNRAQRVNDGVKWLLVILFSTSVLLYSNFILKGPSKMERQQRLMVTGLCNVIFWWPNPVQYGVSGCAEPPWLCTKMSPRTHQLCCNGFKHYWEKWYTGGSGEHLEDEKDIGRNVLIQEEGCWCHLPTEGKGRLGRGLLFCGSCTHLSRWETHSGDILNCCHTNSSDSAASQCLRMSVVGLFQTSHRDRRAVVFFLPFIYVWQSAVLFLFWAG